jgi:hypothetical protein
VVVAIVVVVKFDVLGNNCYLIMYGTSSVRTILLVNSFSLYWLTYFGLSVSLFSLRKALELLSR